LPVPTTNWVDALSTDELPHDDVWPVTVAGRDLAAYTAAPRSTASDNLCTHGNARLCDGFLEGHRDRVPAAQGRFDVRDGRPLGDPVTAPVRVYPRGVEGGRVYIGIEADA
jgi:naphthalene 1,2-dioxygenase system ferredoxin subunit